MMKQNSNAIRWTAQPRRSLVLFPPLRKGGQGGSRGVVIALCLQIGSRLVDSCRSQLNSMRLLTTRASFESVEVFVETGAEFFGERGACVPRCLRDAAVFPHFF